jgi:deoxyribonuclease V
MMGGGGLRERVVTGSREIGWPSSTAGLHALQLELGRREPPPWRPVAERRLAVALCSSRARPGWWAPGAAEILWAAATAIVAGARWSCSGVVVRGSQAAPYVPGLLALREGELLEQAVVSLGVVPDVVLWNGRAAIPRRADRCTSARRSTCRAWGDGSAAPGDAGRSGGRARAAALLVLEGAVVGFALRTRRRARPVFAHAAWRTGPDVAREVVLAVTGRYRTPEPIRLARRLVREARARDEGRAPGLADRRA